MGGGETAQRIWYESFTDPDVEAPYFGRLGDHVRSATSPGFEVIGHFQEPDLREAPAAVEIPPVASRGSQSRRRRS